MAAVLAVVTVAVVTPVMFGLVLYCVLHWTTLSVLVALSAFTHDTWLPHLVACYQQHVTARGEAAARALAEQREKADAELANSAKRPTPSSPSSAKRPLSSSPSSARCLCAVARTATR
jgi:hypothetical protein